MKTATVLAFAAVLLAGCTSSGDSTAPQVAAAEPSPIGDTTTPRVTAVGTNPIKPSKQAAFCQDQVAYMYRAEPQYASTRERVVAADGSTTIDVTIDKGIEGVKTFKCRLDASNRFVDVVAANDGVL
jgi:ABC-type Fe3+-hydroxamate transport system substrate-binding protein